MQIAIRALREADLDAADRIFRLAFGTFLGVPDPHTFAGDTDYVRTRWRAAPAATVAAVRGAELLGSNFAAQWGSFGFFGPLSVRPDLWDKGVARRLLDATMEQFDAWQLSHAGLFTFPNSPKHLVLYQRYGFAPRFLTAILQKPVAGSSSPAPPQQFSALTAAQRTDSLTACRGLTDSILEGLDVAHEIEAVQDQALGDTLLLGHGAQGFAVCHVGPHTEAGSGACYVKFGAVRSGADAPAHFARLLDGAETFAASRRAAVLVTGVNTARAHAYRLLLERGFRIVTLGVAMLRPNQPGFDREDAWVLCDLR